MAEIDPNEAGTITPTGIISRHGEFWRNVPTYDRTRTGEVFLGGEEVVIGGEEVTW